MSRSNRRVIAKDTLEKLEMGYYINEAGITIDFKTEQATALANTILYTPEATDLLLTTHKPQHLETPTIFETKNETTLNAVRRLLDEGESHVLCLNFASAKNPGGGFLGGSQAQEESIARATGLYPCLLKCRAYYDTHRRTRTCLYTDNMIYAPAVPILKKESGAVMDKLQLVSIITSPAVNAGVVRRQEKKKAKKIEPVMLQRIAKVLAVAQKHGHTTLVLGAWGCGVFQNNPEEMAKWFRTVFDNQFKNQFKRVVFAVYAKDEARFLLPFARLFGGG